MFSGHITLIRAFSPNSMSNPQPEDVPIPLLRALERRVLPWHENWGMERCLIVPTDFDNPLQLRKWLDTGGAVTSKPLKGRRISVKGPRAYGNRSMTIARWPEDGLESARIPSFVCVLGGEADLQIGGRLMHCAAGHSMVLLPETPRPDGSASHLVGENRVTGRCELLWMVSSAESGIGCWICHSEGERHFEQPAESCHVPDPAVVALFELFMAEATGAGTVKGDRTICRHLFQALLIALCREIGAGRIFQFARQKAGLPREAMQSRLHDPIPAAQDYIKAHLHLPLRIDDVARQILLSRTEFTGRFRRQTGQTFNEYLTDLRLQEAGRLLESTSWSVQLIGKAVGFNSSRLRVLFNRHHGVSPQQYRAQRQSQTVQSQAVQSPGQLTRNKRETRRRKPSE